MIAAEHFEALYGLGGKSDPSQWDLWLAMIGWFILTAARQSRAQADARGALADCAWPDIMSSETSYDWPRDFSGRLRSRR